jgi:hypothetical protein
MFLIYLTGMNIPNVIVNTLKANKYANYNVSIRNFNILFLICYIYCTKLNRYYFKV